MLIFMQCPNATHVAGYHDWRRNFGRQVKRGERGITILAPCPYRRQEEVEEAASDGLSSTSIQWVQRMGSRTVTVCSDALRKSFVFLGRKITGARLGQPLGAASSGHSRRQFYHRNLSALRTGLQWIRGWGLLQCHGRQLHHRTWRRRHDAALVLHRYFVAGCPAR